MQAVRLTHMCCVWIDALQENIDVILGSTCHEKPPVWADMSVCECVAGCLRVQ